MGTLKGPTEGGSGGKRGHSNMEHWDETEVIKAATKVRRRNNSKKEISSEVDNYEKSKSSESKNSEPD